MEKNWESPPTLKALGDVSQILDWHVFLVMGYVVVLKCDCLVMAVSVNDWSVSSCHLQAVASGEKGYVVR